MYNPSKLGVVWEGAFFANHSLALINREVSLLLKDRVDIGLINKGERQFGTVEELRFSVLDNLLNRVPEKIDFHIRHQYPPDFATPCLGRYILMQPWEYGYLPVNWVEPVNTWVSEVWAYTNYVHDVYVRSGVAPDKVKLVPLGVNPRVFHPQAKPVGLKTNKGFKFLFLGGAVYRKGFDILLEAYTEEFSRNEDVCLVVKDFFYGGEGRNLLLAKQNSNPDCPEVLYMYCEVLPSQVAGFYTACDCFVFPYRSEGYGLPVAEAMACGLPVIVTGEGACMDFCRPDYAYLIPATEERFPQKSVAGINTVNYPFVAKPDKNYLRMLMRHVFENRAEAKAKGLRAYQEISTNHTLERTAGVIVERLKMLANAPLLEKTSGTTQRSDVINHKAELVLTYEDMYRRRWHANKNAFCLDFWQNHFSFRAALNSPILRGHILDAGCGTGEIDIWLARNGRRITGIDVCPTAVKVAEHHLANETPDVQQRVNFYEGLIEEMPFADNSFDSCLISDLIQNVADPEPLFKSIARVLKKDGTVLITVPLVFACNDPTHLHHFDGDSLRAYLGPYSLNIKINVIEAEQQIVAEMSRLTIGNTNKNIEHNYKNCRSKIVCMMRIKNEERWIAQSLAQTSRLADAIVILDDGSTDNTPKICKSFPKVVKYEWQNEPKMDEARDKNKLLKWALELEPDWILALDGDEVLEDIAPEVIRELIEYYPPEVTKLELEWLYLWDMETRYRVDGLYRDVFHPRLFKVKGQDPANLRFLSSGHGANLHCGSIPPKITGRTVRLSIKVKHYGYFFRDQRERKYHWYCGKDPHAARAGYYNHLIDETGIQFKSWQERNNLLAQILSR